MQTRINKDICKGCGLCVLACPKKCIKLTKGFNGSGFKWAEITDIKKCNQCALCCQMCPDVAIEIKEE